LARKYYRLTWTPRKDRKAMEARFGWDFVYMAIHDGPLNIYGYEERSKHPDDKRIMDEKYEQGFIYGQWFSSNCPEGELGFHHLSRLTEITESEFKAWKRLVTS
jgi:hypothetical protein